jgi:histidyl-tRNA synthetase
MGSSKPLFDALIIQAGYQILTRVLGENIRIKLNTLGDTENRKEYLKILTDFYQQHLDKLADKDKERVSSNPLRVLDSKEAATIEVNKKVPTIIDTLNDESKDHFDMVCSYLDKAGVRYELDHRLVRGLDYYTHTVFEYICEGSFDGKSLALGGGGRYDGLAETLGHSKPIPAIGLGLGVDRIVDVLESQEKTINDYQFRLLVLDEEQVLHVHKLLDPLSALHIEVDYRYSKQGIGAQLAQAQEDGMSHVLIYGNQEAQEHTIVVRNVSTREQVTVPLSELATYLKKVEKKTIF